jgi:protease IV
VKRRAGLLAAVLAMLATTCTPRTRTFAPEETEQSSKLAPGTRYVLELDLSSGAPAATDGGLLELPAARTYTGLVRAIERGLADENSGGAFIRFGAHTFDWAESEELGELFARLKAKGKPVVCHAHSLNNSTSLITSKGCTKVWLSPAGDIETIGIGAQIVYLRGLLDRLKIGVDFLAIGRYKSAAETFTREGPSDDAREALSSTLGSIRQSFLDGAEAGRKGIRGALEHGPWTAEEAKRQGLIDEVGFEQDALRAAQALAGAPATNLAFGPRSSPRGGFDIGEIVRILSGTEGGGTGRPHIAVVPAGGAITMQAGGPLDGGGITAKALTKTLRRLRDDDAVKAVVLRIDSPGGSPLASDLIWKEIVELKKKKPVIGSVGSMAASGGYYVVCATQRVFAEQTSIVGSIGVFGGKIVFGPALAEFGINSVTFPASPEPGAAERAAFASPLTAWDDATRTRVRAQMQSIYDLFVSRVAESRKLPLEKVKENAEGRIWSGAQGLERGLVDEIGGLSKAIAAARKLAALGEEAPVTVEGGAESLLEMLLLGEDSSEAQIREAVARLGSKEQTLLAQLPKQVRPFIATMAPLLQGEHVIAALPFAVTIE